MTTTASGAPPRTRESGLPRTALLALATAVFITSLTETLPAGVLPGMAASLDVGAGAAGQSVTVYAAGTALTAIPLAAATASVPRKPLLLAAMAVFLVANTLTAVAPGYAVLLAARFLAGVAAGLAWAILAGYARRIAPAGSEGRAIAVAMTGIPVALSLGVPAGTLIGEQAGWRAAFGAVSLATLAVIGWIAVSVPAVGRPAAEGTGTEGSGTEGPAAEGPGADRPTLRRTLAVPGVAAVMVAVAVFVLGHTVLYAYIAPYLRHAGLGPVTDAVLLAFGVACLLSIWCVGRLVDRRPRALMVTAAALFTLATAALAVTGSHPVVWTAAVLWGLGWGGAPTLLQTAAGRAAARHGAAAADTAQAVLVTLWNAAMALGGVIGGALLAHSGAGAVAATAAALGGAALLVVAGGQRHAFPRT
ncbi:MFS transporter [Streptomyces sp. NPDC058369]|uniref:MFS transporter n=1 Tax=unclassified Streptomyces TaxID=2593676 RepID=UPI002252DCD3|nr:MFS transporter [Streptomyces sp. NBC_01789]MCX4448541.1 MFS transporter [Streptomyces sp. NBC_01789]